MLPKGMELHFSNRDKMVLTFFFLSNFDSHAVLRLVCCPHDKS